MRLSTSSFAGMGRTLVAVGTVRLAAMLTTVRAAAPRNRAICSSATAPSPPAGPAAGAGAVPGAAAGLGAAGGIVLGAAGAGLAAAAGLPPAGVVGAPFTPFRSAAGATAPFPAGTPVTAGLAALSAVAVPAGAAG